MNLPSEPGNSVASPGGRNAAIQAIEGTSWGCSRSNLPWQIQLLGAQAQEGESNAGKRRKKNHVGGGEGKQLGQAGSEWEATTVDPAEQEENLRDAEKAFWGWQEGRKEEERQKAGETETEDQPQSSKESLYSSTYLEGSSEESALLWTGSAGMEEVAQPSVLLWGVKLTTLGALEGVKTWTRFLPKRERVHPNPEGKGGTRSKSSWLGTYAGKNGASSQRRREIPINGP